MRICNTTLGKALKALILAWLLWLLTILIVGMILAVVFTLYYIITGM
jgi:hypothetical protein